MKGISRIESEKCVGWFVRAYRGGKTYSKLFSDLKHGGKNKALAQAKLHLEHLEKTLPPTNRVGLDGPSFYTKLMKHNKTGVNGVFRSFNTNGHSGKTYAFYGVHYKLDGKSKIKKVYVHHFRTERAALKEAARLRRAFEVQMLKEWQLKTAR